MPLPSEIIIIIIVYSTDYTFQCSRETFSERKRERGKKRVFGKFLYGFLIPDDVTGIRREISVCFALRTFAAVSGLNDATISVCLRAKVFGRPLISANTKYVFSGYRLKSSAPPRTSAVDCVVDECRERRVRSCQNNISERFSWTGR